jgi:hypothetical protein
MYTDTKHYAAPDAQLQLPEDRRAWTARTTAQAQATPGTEWVEAACA